ncbi:MAG: HU family DNA-binding protein [Bacteroidota bacterium]
MTKADIVNEVASSTGLTRAEAEAAVGATLDAITGGLKKGENVEFRGFGTFKVQHRAARTARNPRTNEELTVPARYVPSFKVSDKLKKEVDGSLS